MQSQIPRSWIESVSDAQQYFSEPIAWRDETSTCQDECFCLGRSQAFHHNQAIMTKACGMWKLVVAMTLRKFCNTLEDLVEIVCGSMCVLDLSTKVKRFIEFECVYAGKTQFDDVWSASPNHCCLI